METSLCIQLKVPLRKTQLTQLKQCLFTFILFIIWTPFKVAPRVEKTEAFLGAVVERCCRSKLLGPATLPVFLRILVKDFGHICPTCSIRFTKILKTMKDLSLCNILSILFLM